jgi:hypothetical protein
MSWARLLVIPALLAVSACGFAPVYGDHPQAVAGDGLPAVKVAQISNRLGVQLTNRLQDSFNPRSLDVPAQYSLTVNLANTSNSFATRADGTAAWTDVTLKADWRLRRISDEKLMTAGQASASTGFSIANDNYSNIMAQSADESRGIDQIAAEIQTQVALYLQYGKSTVIAEDAGPPPPPTPAAIQP